MRSQPLHNSFSRANCSDREAVSTAQPAPRIFTKPAWRGLFHQNDRRWAWSTKPILSFLTALLAAATILSPASANSSQKEAALETGTSQSVFNLGASESLLAWEKWHKLVGKALGKQAKHYTNGLVGQVLIEVTIFADKRLSAKLLESTNAEFGQTCLQAVRELSGDQVLSFPAESKRPVVQFKFQYKRGFVLIPHNHYIKDDYEQLSR